MSTQTQTRLYFDRVYVSTNWSDTIRRATKTGYKRIFGPPANANKHLRRPVGDPKSHLPHLERPIELVSFLPLLRLVQAHRPVHVYPRRVSRRRISDDMFLEVNDTEPPRSPPTVPSVATTFPLSQRGARRCDGRQTTTGRWRLGPSCRRRRHAS
jgi:hypothetical protein